MSEFKYELYIDNYCIYANKEINYVFHEYLCYFDNNKDCELSIKKYLDDHNKHYKLYLENIKYNPDNHIFVSESSVYPINHIPYLNKLLNHTNHTNHTNHEEQNKRQSNKVTFSPTIKKIPIKTINYNNNKIINKDEETVAKEPIDELKLKELEKMIFDMEQIKEEQLEKLKEEQTIIENKAMEERALKMKERINNDKKKELKNIFEADRRLYYTIKEIKTEYEKFKYNSENNIIDTCKNNELSRNQLTAKAHFTSNREYEIPIMFIHKYPVFKFMDECNIIEHEYAFYVYKIIYYTNYELTTESRKYFGNNIYLLNAEELETYNSVFSEEQKELINTCSKELQSKAINIDKLITDKIYDSNKKFSSRQNNENINDTLFRVDNQNQSSELNESIDADNSDTESNESKNTDKSDTESNDQE